MTSREIVQRLIDDHIINGEEAFTLINDICKNEIYDVWKTLEGTKQGSTWYYNPTYIPTYSTTAATTTIKGTDTDYSITAISGNNK